jgi:hypothetical protein
MRRATYLVIAFGLVAQGATAHADAEAGDDWFPAAMTTDRIGTETWAANVELAYNAFDGDVFDDGTVMRLDLYGQYLAQVGENRLGGYAWIPFARPFGFDGDQETVVGNPEFGGAFAMATAPTTDIVLRGGLVPPAADEEDGFGVVFSSYGRFTDAFTSLPDFTWLRLSGSLLHAAAPYFLRVDLGFDVPFADDEDIDGLLRINAAAGIDLDAVVLLGELATLGLVGGDDDERFLHTLALTVRGRGQTFSPGVSLVVPLDDELNDLVDFAILAGVRIAGPN